MRTLLFFPLLCLVGTLVGRAQSYEELAMRYQRPRMYHEAVALPAGEEAVVVVSFRISNQMLVFMRNHREGVGRAFVAEPHVTVQIYRGRTVVAEQVWREPHYAATFEETQQQDVDLEGALTFQLPPGSYAYRLQLGDAQSDRERAPAIHPMIVPDFRSPYVGAPLMACAVRPGGATIGLDLINLGGDVAYGQAAYAVLPVSLSDSLDAGTSALRYVLRHADASEPESTQEDDIVVEGTIEGTAWVPVWTAAEVVWGDGEAHWPVATAFEKKASYLIPVDLLGAALSDGAYVLETTLVAGAVSVKRSFRFKTHWRDMPISLYDPDIAIRNLRFIEDRQTIKQLRRGTRAEEEAHIRAYWQERDPTPETPFNELMNEYYQRVDHAADAFRTGQTRMPDGLRTDQASVYVVHGPPDKIDRTFPESGGVRERWTYAGGVQFVFWASTSLDPFRLESRSTR